MPQVVEHVEEVVVVADLAVHLTVALEVYRKFVGRTKMHLAPLNKVNEYFPNLMVPFIITGRYPSLCFCIHLRNFLIGMCFY